MKTRNNIKSHYLILVISTIIWFSCGTSKKTLTECDHYSGWCKEIRDLSEHSWKYAQLSKNVYKRSFTFDVSEYYKKIDSFEHKQLDFYAELYRNKTNNSYALVYRGTDSAKDFKTGNNPFKQEQNNYGLIIFDHVINKYKPKDITAVGHSLGGGIATHISLNRENVNSYSFNGSPVFKNNNDFENTRYSIVERGEILKLFRIFGREATQLYTSISCSKGNPIKQHDMGSLATCLTQIAAISNKEAKKSLENNRIELIYKK